MRQESSPLSSTPWVIGAAVMGAAEMYLLDPVQGDRRRVQVRDQATSVGSRTRKSWRSSWRSSSQDLLNRAQSLWAEAIHRIFADIRGQAERQLGIPNE